MSSWTQVDFGLVRYSPLENTHYFYDPNYPAAIQFLLNGLWESWDVSYVKFKALDPEIRRIAEEAEARILRDNVVPGYRQWPSPPPPGGPAQVGPYTPSVESVDSPLHSPSSLFRENLSPEPSPRRLPSIRHPRSEPYPTPNRVTHGPSYATPYAMERPTSRSYTSAPVDSAPTHRTALQPIVTNLSGPSNANGTQHSGVAPHEPYIPPAAPPAMVRSKSRETKILLSLDGDGVRGLSQVLLVESLVNAVCTKMSAPVDPHQVFDLIGGCSMGGILAILLSRLRMQAHRAREAYKLIQKEVYLDKRDFFTSFDLHAPPNDKDAHAVENAIKAVVAREVANPEEPLLDLRADSSDVFVVTTQIDIGTNKAGLIRSYQTRRITGPELDSNMTIWQAMRATSLAPRYMYPREGVHWRPVIEPGLVDHGTAKNNPIRDIRYECSKLSRYGNDTMVIVSIGTGFGLDCDRDPEIAKSVHERTVEADMFGERFESEHQVQMANDWMKYFRFNVDLAGVPLDEWCQEELIREKTLAYLATEDVGRKFYACVDAITTVLVSGNMGRDAVPSSW